LAYGALAQIAQNLCDSADSGLYRSYWDLGKCRVSKETAGDVSQTE